MPIQETVYWLIKSISLLKVSIVCCWLLVIYLLVSIFESVNLLLIISCKQRTYLTWDKQENAMFAVTRKYIILNSNSSCSNFKVFYRNKQLYFFLTVSVHLHFYRQTSWISTRNWENPSCSKTNQISATNLIINIINTAIVLFNKINY